MLLPACQRAELTSIGGTTGAFAAVEPHTLYFCEIAPQRAATCTVSPAPAEGVFTRRERGH